MHCLNCILYSFLTGKPILVDMAIILFFFLLVHSELERSNEISGPRNE